jgi:hypothetical protein
MNITDLFPNNYLRPEDLSGDTPFTIKGVECRELRERSGENTQKAVVGFKESDKGLPLNKTNAVSIASLYGEETEAWTGKLIMLYATPVSTPEGIRDGIRVRDTAPASEQEEIQF